MTRRGVQIQLPGSPVSVRSAPRLAPSSFNWKNLHKKGTLYPCAKRTDAHKLWGSMDQELPIEARTPAQLLGSLTEFEDKHAPKLLYLRGDADLLRLPRISVVGSRRVSEAGKSRARAIAKALVDHGYVVVSGLAEGVDSVAHKTAIAEGGRTIAVLGTPLDTVYPRSNADLFETIVTDHLAVSQFPIGYPVMPKNFVLRNRTMALLSDATIIVEAGAKSGTEHQGWEATRLGRPVFILENVINENRVPWAEKLVEYGAHILSRNNLGDALEDVPQVTSPEALAF